MKSFKIMLVLVGTAWAVVVGTYAAQVANETKHGDVTKIIKLQTGGSCSSSSSGNGA